MNSVCFFCNENALACLIFFFVARVRGYRTICHMSSTTVDVADC
jgi:hypothetical protein